MDGADVTSRLGRERTGFGGSGLPDAGLNRSDARGASAAPASSRASALAGLRILVVEDDPDARELVCAVLTHAGAVVECASSAADGLDVFRRFNPELLVSDIAMPDEDGYSLMRRVRSLGASGGGAIPAIAVSAFTRAEDRAAALAAGFTLHIGKPVLPADLVDAIEALIGSAPERER